LANLKSLVTVIIFAYNQFHLTIKS